MGKKTVERKSDVLVKIIIESIKQHKGKEVVSLDLREIETAESEFFIICHGTSNTHIASITEKPMLCRLFLLFGLGLPRPTKRSII